MQHEKAEQQTIVELIEVLGGRVWVLGTRRRRGDHPGTMQSSGLPDLVAFLPRRVDSPYAMPYELLVIECKAAGGRLRAEQRELQTFCQQSGTAHVTGGIDDVTAWLEAHGYIERGAVRVGRRR